MDIVWAAAGQPGGLHDLDAVSFQQAPCRFVERRKPGSAAEVEEQVPASVNRVVGCLRVGVLDVARSERMAGTPVRAAGWNCAAGGSYLDGGGHQHGFVAVEKNGRWGRAIEVPGLPTLNNKDRNPGSH